MVNSQDLFGSIREYGSTDLSDYIDNISYKISAFHYNWQDHDELADRLCLHKIIHLIFELLNKWIELLHPLMELCGNSFQSSKDSIGQLSIDLDTIYPFQYKCIRKLGRDYEDIGVIEDQYNSIIEKKDEIDKLIDRVKIDLQ